MDSLIVADRFMTSIAGSKGPCPSSVKKVCHFSCKICFNLAEHPVFNVICGHLFCWCCLYDSCTSSNRQKEGRPRGCPFCGCHLDISAGLTVLPLYSGHVPGELRSFDTKDEDRLIEEVYKDGQGCVAPRPSWYHDGNHASPAECIIYLFGCFNHTKYMYKDYLPHLFASGPPTHCELSFIQNLIAELIGDLQGGRQWLTGREYVRQPITGKSSDEETEVLPEEEAAITRRRGKEQQKFQFDMLPTTDDFSINLSSFSCGICKATAFEPVVSVCGHLFCWMCLYNEISGCSSCRVCGHNINIYPSRGNINPIYCEPNERLKEDKFLKCSRRKDNDKLAPSRPPPTVAAPFVDYMIERVIKLEDAIMTELTYLQDNHTRKDSIKNVILRIEGHWDELYRDLLIRWRKVSGEQTPEKFIRPTLLEGNIPKMIKCATKERTEYNYSDLLVDITGDTSTDYQKEDAKNEFKGKIQL